MSILNQFVKKIHITLLICFIFTTISKAVISSFPSLQDIKVTITCIDQHVLDIFEEISKQSGILFFYNEDVISGIDNKISLSFKNESVEKVLSELSKQTNLSFRQIDNTISVSRQISIPDVTIPILVQQIVITGKITDELNEPIPGANIIIKGSSVGVISDIDGNYSITINSENDILSFSFVGYSTREIAVNDQRQINVTLVEDLKELEEIVVIGYGTQKKANVSGAITSVGSRDLHSLATNDAGQALQGKAPVYIARRSGAPGSETSIFLRGVGSMRNSSPLWIVDGIKDAPLDNFNDVESIQILKDAASAAIYGVEAANGVILVTTKRGKQGKASVNYNGYVKINNPLNLPELLGTRAYRDMYVARWKQDNPTLDPSSMKSFYHLSQNEIDKLPNTDWLDELFRTGVNQVHTFTLTGGNEKNTYLASLIHEEDKGTFVNTNYKRSAVKLALSQQVTKWLRLEETVNYRFSKDRPTMSTQSEYIESSMWNSVLRAHPAMKPYDDTNPMGTGYGYFTDEFMSSIDWQGINPLESFMSSDYWIKNDKAWGNFKMIVTPIKGLVWTTNISGSITNRVNSKFFYDNYGGASSNIQEFSKTDIGKNQFAYNERSTKEYLLNSFLDYSWTVTKNQFGVMIGTEVFESMYHGASISTRYGIPSQDLRTTELAPSDLRKGYNYKGSNSGYSFFGRLVYSYDSRYLLTATFRNDVSSIFAPGNRQAFFPAVSIGWNIANESFFPVEAINDLKLRYGLGKSGNDDVPANLWRQEYAQNSNGAWLAQKLVNEDITWETTTTNNIGLDIGIWNNSLTATIDVYDKETKDALLYLKVPAATGFSNYYINRGSIKNTGMELTLGYRKAFNEFNFAVNGNIAYNKNKVLEIGDAAYLAGGDFNRTYKNGPVSAFYGYVADGLYQSQSEIDILNAKAITNGFETYNGTVGAGDLKFKDLNGDGTITGDNDQQILGNPWPKYVYGFNIHAGYKGVDFSMSWQGIAKVDVYNNTKKYTENMFGDYNSTAKVFDTWTTENSGSSIPRLGNSAHNFGTVSSYFIEDGSYLRLKNLQIGYDLSRLSFFQNLKLQQLRIYAGVENLLTITKFDGFDPEFMSGDSNYQRGVYNIDQYPQSRSFIFGIQLGF